MPKKVRLNDPIETKNRANETYEVRGTWKTRIAVPLQGPVENTPKENIAGANKPLTFVVPPTLFKDAYARELALRSIYAKEQPGLADHSVIEIQEIHVPEGPHEKPREFEELDTPKIYTDDIIDDITGVLGYPNGSVERLNFSSLNYPEDLKTERLILNSLKNDATRKRDNNLRTFGVISNAKATELAKKIYQAAHNRWEVWRATDPKKRGATPDFKADAARLARELLIREYGQKHAQDLEFFLKKQKSFHTSNFYITKLADFEALLRVAFQRAFSRMRMDEKMAQAKEVDGIKSTSTEQQPSYTYKVRGQGGDSADKVTRTADAMPGLMPAAFEVHRISLKSFQEVAIARSMLDGLRAAAELIASPFVRLFHFLADPKELHEVANSVAPIDHKRVGNNTHQTFLTQLRFVGQLFDKADPIEHQVRSVGVPEQKRMLNWERREATENRLKKGERFTPVITERKYTSGTQQTAALLKSAYELGKEIEETVASKSRRKVAKTVLKLTEGISAVDRTPHSQLLIPIAFGEGNAYQPQFLLVQSTARRTTLKHITLSTPTLDRAPIQAITTYDASELANASIVEGLVRSLIALHPRADKIHKGDEKKKNAVNKDSTLPEILSSYFGPAIDAAKKTLAKASRDPVKLIYTALKQLNFDENQEGQALTGIHAEAPHFRTTPVSRILSSKASFYKAYIDSLVEFLEENQEKLSNEEQLKLLKGIAAYAEELYTYVGNEYSKKADAAGVTHEIGVVHAKAVVAHFREWATKKLSLLGASVAQELADVEKLNQPVSLFKVTLDQPIEKTLTPKAVVVNNEVTTYRVAAEDIAIVHSVKSALATDPAQTHAARLKTVEQFEALAQCEKKVVATVTNPAIEISLADAQKLNSRYTVGQTIDTSRLETLLITGELETARALSTAALQAIPLPQSGNREKTYWAKLQIENQQLLEDIDNERSTIQRLKRPYYTRRAELQIKQRELARKEAELKEVSAIVIPPTADKFKQELTDKIADHKIDVEKRIIYLKGDILSLEQDVKNYHAVMSKNDETIKKSEEHLVVLEKKQEEMRQLIGRWSAVFTSLAEKMAEAVIRSGNFPLAPHEALEYHLVLPLVLRTLYDMRLKSFSSIFDKKLTQYLWNSAVDTEGKTLLDKNGKPVEAVTKMINEHEKFLAMRKKELEPETRKKLKEKWDQEDKNDKEELNRYNRRLKQYQRDLREYQRARQEPDFDPTWYREPTEPDKPIQKNKAEKDAFRALELTTELLVCGDKDQYYRALSRRDLTDFDGEWDSFSSGVYEDKDKNRLEAIRGHFSRIIGLQKREIAYALHQRAGGVGLTIPEHVRSHWLLEGDMSLLIGSTPALEHRYQAAKNSVDALPRSKEEIDSKEFYGLLIGYDELGKEGLELTGWGQESEKHEEFKGPLRGAFRNGEEGNTWFVPVEVMQVRKVHECARLLDFASNTVKTYHGEYIIGKLPRFGKQIQGMIDMARTMREDDKEIPIEKLQSQLKGMPRFYLVPASGARGGTYVLSASKESATTSLCMGNLDAWKSLDARTKSREHYLGGIPTALVQSRLEGDNEREVFGSISTNHVFGTNFGHEFEIHSTLVGSGPGRTRQELDNIGARELSPLTADAVLHNLYLRPQELADDEKKRNVLYDHLCQRGVVRRALEENPFFFEEIGAVLKQHSILFNNSQRSDMVAYIAELSGVITAHAIDLKRESQASVLTSQQFYDKCLNLQKFLSEIQKKEASKKPPEDAEQLAQFKRDDNLLQKFIKATKTVLDKCKYITNQDEEQFLLSCLEWNVAFKNFFATAKTPIERRAVEEAFRAAYDESSFANWRVLRAIPHLLPKYDAPTIAGLFDSKLNEAQQLPLSVSLLRYFANNPPAFSDTANWVRIFKALYIYYQSPFKTEHLGVLAEMEYKLKTMIPPFIAHLEAEPTRLSAFLSDLTNRAETRFVKDPKVAYCFNAVDATGKPLLDDSLRPITVDLATGKGAAVGIKTIERDGRLPKEITEHPDYKFLFGEKFLPDLVKKDDSSKDGIIKYLWTVGHVNYEVRFNNNAGEKTVQIFQKVGDEKITTVKLYRFAHPTLEPDIWAIITGSRSRPLEKLIESKGLWIQVAKDAKGREFDDRTQILLAQHGQKLEDPIRLKIHKNQLLAATVGVGEEAKYVCTGFKDEFGNRNPDAPFLPCRQSDHLLLLSSDKKQLDEIRFPKEGGSSENSSWELILKRNKQDPNRWDVDERPGWELRLTDTLAVAERFGPQWREFVLPLYNREKGLEEYYIYPYPATSIQKNGSEVVFLKKLSDYAETFGVPMLEKFDLGEISFDGEDAMGLVHMADSFLDVLSANSFKKLTEKVPTKNQMREKFQEQTQEAQGFLSSLEEGFKGFFNPSATRFIPGRNQKNSNAVLLYLANIAALHGKYGKATEYVHGLKEGRLTPKDIDQFVTMIQFLIVEGVLDRVKDFKLPKMEDIAGGNFSVKDLPSLPTSPRSVAFLLKLIIAVEEMRIKMDSSQVNAVTIFKMPLNMFTPVMGIVLKTQYDTLVKTHARDLDEQGLRLTAEEELAFTKMVSSVLGPMGAMASPLIQGILAPQLAAAAAPKPVEPIAYTLPSDTEIDKCLEAIVRHHNPSAYKTIENLHHDKGAYPKVETVLANFMTYWYRIEQDADLKWEDLAFLMKEIPAGEKERDEVHTARRLLLLLFHYKHGPDFDRRLAQNLRKGIEELQPYLPNNASSDERIRAYKRAQAEYVPNGVFGRLKKAWFVFRHFGYRGWTYGRQKELDNVDVAVTEGGVTRKEGVISAFKKEFKFFYNNLPMKDFGSNRDDYRIVPVATGNSGVKVYSAEKERERLAEKAQKAQAANQQRVPDIDDLWNHTVENELLNHKDIKNKYLLETIVSKTLSDQFRPLLQRPVDQFDQAWSEIVAAWQKSFGYLDSYPRVSPYFNTISNIVYKHFVDYHNAVEKVRAATQVPVMQPVPPPRKDKAPVWPKVELPKDAETQSWRDRFEDRFCTIDTTELWDAKERIAIQQLHMAKAKTSMEKHSNTTIVAGLEQAKKEHMSKTNRSLKVERVTAMREDLEKRAAAVQKELEQTRATLLSFAEEYAYPLGILPVYSDLEGLPDEHIIQRVVALVTEGKASRLPTAALQKELVSRVVNYLHALSEQQQLKMAGKSLAALRSLLETSVKSLPNSAALRKEVVSLLPAIAEVVGEKLKGRMQPGEWNALRDKAIQKHLEQRTIEESTEVERNYIIDLFENERDEARVAQFKQETYAKLVKEAPVALVRELFKEAAREVMYNNALGNKVGDGTHLHVNLAQKAVVTKYFEETPRNSVESAKEILSQELTMTLTRAKLQAKADYTESWLRNSHEMLYYLRGGSDRLRYDGGDGHLLHPDRTLKYLAWEAAEGNVARPKAIEAVDAMLKSPKPARFVMVRMGVGKSSFIFPMLCRLFIERGKMPVVMTTEELVNQLGDYLNNNKGYPFKFDINYGLPPKKEDGKTDFTDEEILKYLIRVEAGLRGLKETEGYVLTTPSARAALRNKRVSLEDSISGMKQGAERSAKFKLLEQVKRIEAFFRQDEIIYLEDEDLNRDINFEYNYAVTSGSSKDFRNADPIRYAMGERLTMEMLKNEDLRNRILNNTLRAVDNPEEILRPIVTTIVEDEAFWQFAGWEKGAWERVLRGRPQQTVLIERLLQRHERTDLLKTGNSIGFVMAILKDKAFWAEAGWDEEQFDAKAKAVQQNAPAIMMKCKQANLDSNTDAATRFRAVAKIVLEHEALWKAAGCSEEQFKQANDANPPAKDQGKRELVDYLLGLRTTRPTGMDAIPSNLKEEELEKFEATHKHLCHVIALKSLLRTFSTVYDVHAQLDRGIREKNGATVVPYRDGVEKPRTQYGEECENILHHFFHYASRTVGAKLFWDKWKELKIKDESAITPFDNWRVKNQIEIPGAAKPTTWKDWRQNISAVASKYGMDDEYEAFSGKGLEQPGREEDRALMAECRVLFLRHIMQESDYIKIYLEQINNNSQELTIGNEPGVRMSSGTGKAYILNLASPDNDTSSAPDVILGETLLCLFELSKASGGLESEVEEFTDAYTFIEQQAAHPHIKAIINGGYELKENKSEELAKALRCSSNPDVAKRQLIYRNQLREKMVWNHGEQHVPESYSEEKIGETAFFYYGPADKRGVDFKVPRGVEAVCLVDMGDDLETLQQMVWRMRQLGNGQHVRLAIDKKMGIKVRKILADAGIVVPPGKGITEGQLIKAIQLKTIENEEISRIKAFCFDAKAPRKTALDGVIHAPYNIQVPDTSALEAFESLLFKTHRSLYIIKSRIDWAKEYEPTRAKKDPLTFCREFLALELQKTTQMLEEFTKEFKDFDDKELRKASPAVQQAIMARAALVMGHYNHQGELIRDGAYQSIMTEIEANQLKIGRFDWKRQDVALLERARESLQNNQPIADEKALRDILIQHCDITLDKNPITKEQVQRGLEIKEVQRKTQEFLKNNLPAQISTDFQGVTGQEQEVQLEIEQQIEIEQMQSTQEPEVAHSYGSASPLNYNDFKAEVREAKHSLQLWGIDLSYRRFAAVMNDTSSMPWWLEEHYDKLHLYMSQRAEKMWNVSTVHNFAFCKFLIMEDRKGVPYVCVITDTDREQTVTRAIRSERTDNSPVPVGILPLSSEYLNRIDGPFQVEGKLNENGMRLIAEAKAEGRAADICLWESGYKKPDCTNPEAVRAILFAKLAIGWTHYSSLELAELKTWILQLDGGKRRDALTFYEGINARFSSDLIMRLLKDTEEGKDLQAHMSRIQVIREKTDAMRQRIKTFMATLKEGDVKHYDCKDLLQTLDQIGKASLNRVKYDANPEGELKRLESLGEQLDKVMK